MLNDRHQQSESTSRDDYAKIQDITDVASRLTFWNTRLRQLRKFKSLAGKAAKRNNRSHRRFRGSPKSSNIKPHLRSRSAFIKQTVVNYSQRTLSTTETDVLALGDKFAITPRSVPVEEIIQAS